MTRAIRNRALVPLFALIAGCSGSSSPTAAPSPDPCKDAKAESVPASCIPGEQGAFEAAPSQSGSPPSSSERIPPVTSPSVPGELARGGNDKDPSVTTRNFTVTLPAGQRLVTTLACQGARDVVLTTKPRSGAEQEFACGYTVPAELTVEDPTPARAATTYVVTVTAKAPARWYVVISASSQPVASG